MTFDSWGVLPGLDEDKYILAFWDTNAALGQPLMNQGDEITEEEIRVELKRMGKSEDEINGAIAKAKAKAKANEERNKSR